MNSPVTINTSVEINLPRSNKVEEKKFKCYCCGASWDNQKGHFSKSAHPRFQSNDGYIDICNGCRDKYYYKLVDLYDGNEEHAIRHMCFEFGWIYHIDALVASRQISTDRSRISHYLAKKNLGQTTRMGTTYIDTIKFEFEEKDSAVIDTLEDITQFEGGDARKLQRNITKWGLGYTDAEYLMLNDHYKLYKDRIDEDDPSQVTLLRNLCEQYILQSRAMKDKDIDKYDKVSKLYQQTLNNANLKPKNQDSNVNNPDECWGNFNKIVETMSPSEYFKDKSIFKDYDEMDEYYQRFIVRSTNNLIDGTTTMDDEYSIKVTDDE